MANTKFQIKRSTVPGKVPNTTHIDTGELALNIPDKKLYSSNGTAIFEVAGFSNSAAYLEVANVTSAVHNAGFVSNSYFTAIEAELKVEAAQQAANATANAINTAAIGGQQYLQVANALPLITNNTVKYLEVANSTGFLQVSNASVYLEKANASVFMEVANLATVATSGDYNDLSNTPIIPDVDPYIEVANVVGTYLSLTETSVEQKVNGDVQFAANVQINANLNLCITPSGANAYSEFSDLIIDDTNFGGITFLSGNTGEVGMSFIDLEYLNAEGTRGDGTFEYRHSTDNMCLFAGTRNVANNYGTISLFTANVETMTITGTNMVGINRTNPDSALHVVGQGKFSGNVVTTDSGLFKENGNRLVTNTYLSTAVQPYLEVANISSYGFASNTYAASNSYVQKYLEVANAAAVIANNTTQYLEVANTSDVSNPIFANVNPRIDSVLSTAATANTKAVQALADAAAANTRAEGARTLAVSANSNLNSYKANVNPRILSVLTTAATANTKAVQALVDAAGANTRSTQALADAASANTKLNAYKANTNPRFDQYLAMANVSATIANNTTTYLEVANSTVFMEVANLATVATSGDYNDLSNRPPATNTAIQMFKYFPSANQSTFTGGDADGTSLAYTNTNVEVYLNGLKLIKNNDFFAPNTTHLTLYANAVSGDSVQIVSYDGTIQTLSEATFAGNTNFDSGTLFVDGTNNRVGIGTTSPSYDLHIEKSDTGSVDLLHKNTGTSSGSNARVMSYVSGASGGDPSIGVGITGVQDYFWRIDNDDSDKLKLDSNGTTRMTVDTAGLVGIGTSSPSSLLAVSSGSSSAAVHSYTKLEIESSSHSALQFSGSTGGEQWIWFADDASSTPVGGITYYHGGPYMGFRVEGSERMRILSGGGITFNGDTAAANALDDYEEGTWTPSFAGGAGRVGTWDSTLTGTYTKIGRLVQINFNLLGTNMGLNTAGGYSYYTGLPFPVARNASGAWGSGAISSNLGGLVWVDVSERIWLYAPQSTSATSNGFDISIVYYTS